MARRGRVAKKRDIKSEEKRKEEVEKDTSQSVPQDSVCLPSSLEDFITCQICKDQISKDHRMCPS